LNAPAVDIPRPHARRRKLRRLVIRLTVVAGLLVAATAAAGRLARTPPKVGRSILAVDTVKRGPFLREVRGRGALIPERSQVLPAPADGTVARALAAAGAVLAAGDVIVQLADPDREQQLREGERALRSAQAELRDFTRERRAALEKQRAAVRSAEADVLAAGRELRSEEDAGAGAAQIEPILDRCRQALDLRAAERRRLALMRRSTSSLATSREARVAAAETTVAQRRGELDRLLVKAPIAGVLTAVHFQPGQRVAAGGPLAEIADTTRLQARLRLDQGQAGEVHAGQVALIDTESAVVPGSVVRVEAGPDGVSVLVAIQGALPQDAQPDLRVEGVITVEVVNDVLHMGRPALASGERTVGLFKLDGRSARRVPVRIGRASADSVEVLGGLAAGDQVILSDMSAWERFDTLRLD
jgi:HlyD family secretion protein